MDSRKKTAIILSISSDIAYEIASDFLKQNYLVIGTYKTTSNKTVNLTFCNNIPELVRRQLANRNLVDIPKVVKLGLDCGKNKLLFTLQSNWIGFVAKSNSTLIFMLCCYLGYSSGH